MIVDVYLWVTVVVFAFWVGLLIVLMIYSCGTFTLSLFVFY